MQFFTAITLLAGAAMAASTDGLTMSARGKDCTPPQYACKKDYSGWLVCNVDGAWLDGGVCPKETTCKEINKLPYCV